MAGWPPGWPCVRLAGRLVVLGMAYMVTASHDHASQLGQHAQQTSTHGQHAQLAS
jgi:hypothetical protein